MRLEKNYGSYSGIFFLLIDTGRKKKKDVFSKTIASCFNKSYVMMQIGQGIINFRRKSGLPGVGKVFRH